MRPKGQLFDLKSFRAKHNLSQKQVALDTNRKQSFLSAIESGRRSAPDALIDDIVRLYGEENISDFLHDRQDPAFGNVQNVQDAIVNSPGGTILVNEFGKKLSQKDILRILEIEKEARDQTEEMSKSEPTPPAQAQPEDQAVVVSLVNLLTLSEARCKEAENKIKILEAKVLDLQAKLDKIPTRATTRATKK